MLLPPGQPAHASVKLGHKDKLGLPAGPRRGRNEPSPLPQSWSHVNQNPSSPGLVLDHRLQDDGVPASPARVVVGPAPRENGRGDGDMGCANRPGTPRGASLLESGHDLLQPLPACKRHRPLVEPLQDGGSDLADDATLFLPSGSGEPPQGDRQPALRLDWDAKVGPASLDGRFDPLEQAVKSGPGHAKLRFPLILIEQFE